MVDGEANRTNGEQRVDAERRSALIAMARGMAYVPPVVATFAMGGLSPRAAHAYVTNITG
ncbi:MAG: hypothetical protein P4M07_09260 [Xanthobacteraceae bacterium]|nr:hypothetical protein [Xanthobacteraceae bacterium]